MKNFKIFLAVFGIAFYSLQSSAQVSPYQIPPKWMFGYKAGFNFGTSPFTNSPPLILTGNPTDNSGGTESVGAIEESTTGCNPASAIVLYSNQIRYYDGTNASFAFPGGRRATGSATDGAVIVPDPGNPNQYYIFMGNDRTGGGGGQNSGINYWIYNASTGVMSAAPVNLVGNVVDESLCAGSDRAGGYWIITHGTNTVANGYYVWHVTATGVTPHATFPQLGTVNNFGDNASIKLNKCQDRIAYGNVAGRAEMYNWNPITGTLGTIIGSNTGLPLGVYGLEISPSGRFIYFGHYGDNRLYQLDGNSMATAPVLVSSTNPNSNTGVGTMQLGPDNKIYVSLVSGTGNTNAVYIGVINAPDVLDLGTGTATGCQYDPQGFTLKPNNGAPYPNMYLGMSNEGWMSPEIPTISLSAGGNCSTLIHTLDFQTYFNSDIDIEAGTLEWSFDNGSTWAAGANPISHDYGGTVTNTARARFKDDVCNNYQWTASVPISTTCPAPVELINFNGEKSGSNVLVSWSTALEINNSHFEVQHSTDGVNFTTIGVVQGNGNSTEPRNYFFIDISPSSGINYYRLVQHDYDGKQHNSRIVSLTFDGLLIHVYPNPSTTNFNVQITGAENAYIIVTDVLGREIYTSSSSEDIMEFSFGNNLPDGSYVIEVITENEVQTKQVLKQ